MARTSLLSLIAVAVVMTIGVLLAHGGGASQASTTHGDLLLDAETGDNTDVSIGDVTRQLCNVQVDSTVRIDVVVRNADDWAAMDFVIYFPSPIVLERPRPDDATDTSLGQLPGDQADINGDVVDAAAGFDFVPFDGATAATFGPNTLLSTGTGSSMDYSLSEGVPDGSSPHGISAFDNALKGESGDGGIARLSLDTTDLKVGEYTLLLGKTKAFAGGVHSDNPPTFFGPVDHFGAFMLAIGQACSTDTDGDGVSDADENAFGSDPDNIDSIPENNLWLPEYSNPNPAQPPGDIPPCSDGVDNDGDGQVDGDDPSCSSTAVLSAAQTSTPTATATPGPTSVAGAVAGATATIPVPSTGGPPTGASGNDWLIVLYVAGGVIAAMTAGGAVSWRLRRRAAKVK